MSIPDRELLDALKALQRDGPFPPRDCSGICGQVEGRIPMEVGKKLKSAFRSWPKFSGIDNYPVPSGEDGVSPTAAFNRKYVGKAKWDKTTVYGQLRWELLEHCIAWLENKLQRKRELSKAGYLRKTGRAE